MPLLGSLLEADGLSVQTALPPFGSGLRSAPLIDVDGFFKTHPAPSGLREAAAASFARSLPAATAFLQAPGRPRQLFGLAAAGASELFGTAPSRTRLSGRGSAGASCKAICLAPGPGCSSHEDFLFGGQLPDSALTPKQSMMWFAAAKATYHGDDNDEKTEDENKGWSKIIPRGMCFFNIVDAITAFVLFTTRNEVCDTPLRTWLVGSMLLGSPTSLLVKGIAWMLKPRFKIVKLKVINCRSSEINGDQFEIEKMMLYDEFGRELFPQTQKQGNMYVNTFKYPTMIGSYKIISAANSQGWSAENDPKTFQLVGSNNGRTWTLIDERIDGQVPVARNSPGPLYTDLTSLEEDVSFRQAFLAELCATGAALAWLTLGSAWIARSSESCVDSSPEIWYWSFLMAVTTWSMLGTVTIGLIVSAVAMIALGVKTSQ